MSWDIELIDPVTKNTLELPVPHHMTGGTYAIGGTPWAELNVTYNYGKWFPFRSLHGKSAAESIFLLKEAAENLSDETDPDYWKPAPGNVKRALLQLLALAQMRPDGQWKVI